ncbi:MAG: aldose epimerase family protein [Eubacteriales bacterium]
MNYKIKPVEDNEEKELKLIEIENDNGIKLEVFNLGGTITKIVTPDGKGNYENIVLEYDDYKTYLTNPSYMGSIIGRMAGRIGNGEVVIDDKEYQFFQNTNKNTLHGGKEGFNLKVWKENVIENDNEVILQLTYTSKDGEENFPGNLDVTVLYTLNNNNELIIEYRANTDKTTLVNLTNHSYFNLSGNAKRDVLNHLVQIKADYIGEVDEELIPTGNKLSVENTPFDFRKAKTIGKDINVSNKELKYGNGYDHAWLLNDVEDSVITFYDPDSSRVMDVTTNQKAVVFYSMNFSDGCILSNGKESKQRYAACFETQDLPIGRGQEFVENSILKPGEEYYQKTIFKFYNK